MFGRFGKFGGILLMLAVAGCATQDAYDIRPDSKDGLPTAVEWQKTADRQIAAATDAKVLAPFVASSAAADALLAKVGKAYETDPLVATQIAAVTQFVVDPKRSDAAAQRAVWRAALLKAAKTSADTYRKLFCLDQLRWCGLAEDVPAVRAVAASSSEDAVKSLAAIVERELSAAP